jgi:hypothetical protein
MPLVPWQDGGQARFALNDVSRRYFASEGDSSVAGYVVHSNKLLYPVWAHLADSV